MGSVPPAVQGSPVFPFSPFSPLSPFGPVSPLAPAAPGDPCGPAGPTGPTGPVLPLGPLGPGGPFLAEAVAWPPFPVLAQAPPTMAKTRAPIETTSGIFMRRFIDENIRSGSPSPCLTMVPAQTHDEPD